MKKCLAMLLLVTVASCGNNEQSVPKPEPSVDPYANVMKGHRSLTTSTGLTVIIAEDHPDGMSLSDIRIFFGKDSLVFRDTDPIEEVLQSDLDADGYDEFYLVTRSAGSGSYGNIIGVASVRDSILSPIIFPPLDPENKMFEGYMGKDQFSIDTTNRVLLRKFPVYKENDNNAKPSGDGRLLRYYLDRKGIRYLLLNSRK
jgi:hypothetical protein